MCDWTISYRDDKGRLAFIPLRAAVKAPEGRGEKAGAKKLIDVQRFQKEASPGQR